MGSVVPSQNPRNPRYTLEECAALLDRAENPFFLFGIDAGRFQIWENYRDGLLSREDALDRLYKNKWEL